MDLRDGSTPANDLTPVHPEAVADDERAMRWLIPPGTLGFVGTARTLPERVEELLDDGTLESLTVEPAAIRTRLGVGRSWSVEGARVRAALQHTLGLASQWEPQDPHASADQVLRMAVEQVVAGQVGDYIRSHGGDVVILDVRDGDVEVRLTGACSHCPAAGLTLTARFETALRALFPELGKVRAHDNMPAEERARWRAVFPGLRR